MTNLLQIARNKARRLADLANGVQTSGRPWQQTEEQLDHRIVIGRAAPMETVVS